MRLPLNKSLIPNEKAEIANQNLREAVKLRFKESISSFQNSGFFNARELFCEFCNLENVFQSICPESEVFEFERSLRRVSSGNSNSIQDFIDRYILRDLGDLKSAFAEAAPRWDQIPGKVYAVESYSARFLRYSSSRAELDFAQQHYLGQQLRNSHQHPIGSLNSEAIDSRLNLALGRKWLVPEIVEEYSGSPYLKELIYHLAFFGMFGPLDEKTLCNPKSRARVIFDFREVLADNLWDNFQKLTTVNWRRSVGIIDHIAPDLAKADAFFMRLSLAEDPNDAKGRLEKMARQDLSKHRFLAEIAKGGLF